MLPCLISEKEIDNILDHPDVQHNTDQLKIAFRNMFKKSCQIFVDNLTSDMYINCREDGAANVLRRLISIYDDIDSMNKDEIKSNIESLFRMYNVNKIELDPECITLKSTDLFSIEKIVDEPDNDDLYYTIKPGYYMKGSKDNIILRYETIAVNKAKFKNKENIVNDIDEQNGKCN